MICWTACSCCESRHAAILRGPAGKEIVQLGFPNTAVISIIKRNGKYITPSGSTVLNAGDILLVLSETKSALKKVYECLEIEPETG